MTDKTINLNEIIFKKDENALLSKADITKIIIDKYGSEAEKLIDNHLKAGANNWAKQEARKDIDSGRQNDIDGFIKFLWEPLKAEGFEFTYQKTNNSCQLKVSRCPIAEIAIKHHIEKWGYKFHCMSDDSICEGYNPRIKMKRTKTKMEGHEYCDHFYYIE